MFTYSYFTERSPSFDIKETRWNIEKKKQFPDCFNSLMMLDWYWPWGIVTGWLVLALLGQDRQQLLGTSRGHFHGKVGWNMLSELETLGSQKWYSEKTFGKMFNYKKNFNYKKVRIWKHLIIHWVLVFFPCRILVTSQVAKCLWLSLLWFFINRISLLWFSIFPLLEVYSKPPDEPKYVTKPAW